MQFKIKSPNYQLSPYTGMTRESWLDAANYLLQGLFQNIKTADDPIVMPRRETVISYPVKNAPVIQKKAEIFEGLARSFFIAAPLILNEPDVNVCGYSIRDYYKDHILRICTKGDPEYVFCMEDIQKETGGKEPFRCYQQTVETAALVICLWTCKKEIWDTYSQKEKDIIADFLSGYGHGNTVAQNWRLFNMLDLAFLYMEGYPIDEDMMRDHAQAILNYYAGDGWYRDGQNFDYYSCWAFSVYAPIWNLWYGYSKEPYLAEKFEEYSNELMKTYADFFDKEGFTMMWGRSNIYRNAATSAFEGNLLLRNSTADPGLSRRIASGSLLQFLTRDDFLYKGVPTLGFYGQYTPLVQSYSCAESPLWMGKVFLCLHFPKDHPYWCEVETNGSWEQLGGMETKTTTLDGPGLSFSNHAASGETILRTGKVLKHNGDEAGMWNYAKLAYNSQYPWEAKPGDKIESQQYVLEDLTAQSIKKCNVTFWHGEKEGILYRRQFFDYSNTAEGHLLQAVNLADFPVSYGIIRADKIRLFERPVKITLGAYGFPDNGTEIIQLSKDGAKAIVLKGHDHTGKEKQLAMTIYDGWEDVSLIHSQGTNPDSHKSIVIYASASKVKQYGYEPYVMVSQVITKESLKDFKEEEIFPIEKVDYTDKEECGGYGPIHIILKNGMEKVIDFQGIEGKLQL